MGAWIIRGQEGYGRRERKKWEVGILKGGEGKYGELCNNTQYVVIEKRAGGRKPRKKGAGAGNARYRSWQVWTPLSPKLTMSKKSSMITT